MPTNRRTFLALLGALPFTRHAAAGAAAFTGEPAPAEALDEALTLLAPYGSSFRGGLSNHGPMAAEALVSLGQSESVVEWVTGYRRRLEARPSAVTRIDPNSWREALGESKRVRDWEDFFTEALAEAPWEEVLATWIPRLAPGMAAAGLHGVIRLGHAGCALRNRKTPQRLDELARALGYWASEYMALPGSPKEPGKLSPSKALENVPLLPRERRRGGGLITDEMSALLDFKPFAPVIDLVDPDPQEATPAFLSDLVGAFAGLYVNTRSSHFEFLHGVTGTAAVAELLPFVGPKDRAAVCAYTWQVTAGLYSRYGVDGLVGELEGDVPKEKSGALGKAALGIGDDHTIKLAAAARREWSRHRDDRLLAAATHRFNRRR